MNDKKRTFLKTLNEQTEENSPAKSLLVRKKLYIIVVGLVLVLVLIIGIWFSIRNSRLHRRNENELVKSILNTYGDYLTYDKQESNNFNANYDSALKKNGRMRVEQVCFVLEQDVDGLPQGLTAICNDYFSDPTKVYPVQIWVRVPQNRNYRNIFVISNYNYIDETLYNEIVTLDIGDDLGDMYPGANYHTLKGYCGTPGIRQLDMEGSTYQYSLETEAVDMVEDYKTMERIDLRWNAIGHMTLFPDRIEISDQIKTANVIDAPQQIMIIGTKTSLILQPDDYELTWNQSQNFNSSQPCYQYRISIYQDSIYEIQNELGYIKEITFQ